jgi:hypothetical protein
MLADRVPSLALLQDLFFTLEPMMGWHGAKDFLTESNHTGMSVLQMFSLIKPVLSPYGRKKNRNSVGIGFLSLISLHKFTSLVLSAYTVWQGPMGLY